jgi:hypothetical protein
MKNDYKIAAATLILAITIGAAHATPIVVTSSLTGTVANGTTENGSFDLSGFLTPGSSMVDGTITANFVQGPGAVTTATSSTGLMYQGSSNTICHSLGYPAVVCPMYQYLQDNYKDAVVSAAIATIAAGSSSASASASSFFGSLTYSLDYTVTMTSYFPDYIDHTIQEYYSRAYGWDGTFSVALGLDAAALLAVNSTDMLDFSLGASSNGFDISSVTLSADIVPSSKQSVPEPLSLGLVGLGLLGVASARLRRTI